MPCLSCAASIPEGSRFCPGCGKPQPSAQANGVNSKPAQTELRQITILFCDLVGSTSLSSSLEPEDLRELINAYQQTCAHVIQRFEGSIAQYLGDGLLVYFGYPEAHEDDPTRALFTALGILEEMVSLNTRLDRIGSDALKVRIGIHTGMVVIGAVGGIGRQEQLAIGEAPNIAARLQGIAEPDRIVLSGETRQLIQGHYDLQSLGKVALKGIEQPVQAYSLHRQTSAGTLPVVRDELPPMMGRETNLAQLQAAWQVSRVGASAVAMICAEPGMGKTLLLTHLMHQVKSDRARTEVLNCSRYQMSAEFHPVLEWMEARLGIEPEDTAVLRFAKLSQGLPATVHPEDVPLMAALLSIALPPGTIAPNITPTVARQRTNAVVARWLRGDSNEDALVVCEDLQWADPTTLEFLAHVSEQADCQRMLLVLTCRPEFSDTQILFLPGLLRLDLQRLSGDEGRAIITRLTGGKSLPPVIVQKILTSTDGIPFYVQEFTRSVLESGKLIEHDHHYELVGELPPGLIPSSLRDSLTARLDRMGDARNVARYASVIGRRFDVGLLNTLCPEGDVSVAASLDRLTDAGLANPSASARGEYEFMHALVQVAAYESMLKRDRIEMHARLAASIDAAFPELAERQPGLVARHLTESRQWGAAINRWLLAGGRSLARSANLEAASQLREGLALVPKLPKEEREPMELALLTTIGPSLIATTGFGSQAVGDTYARTRDLCVVLGDRPEAFPSLWGSWVYNLVRGQLRMSLGYATQMRDMGQTTGQSMMLVEAYWTTGNTLYWMGDLQETNHCLALAVSHYDPELHAANAIYFGQDPAIAAECYRAYTLLHMGHADQSVAAWQRAQTRAHSRQHQFSTAWVLAFDHMLWMYRRDPHKAKEAANKALTFCHEQGAPFWVAASYTVRGWSRAMTGETAEGIAEIRQGMHMYELTGSLLVQPLWHAILAEALIHSGQLEEAGIEIELGLQKAHINEERLSEIELWIAKGDLARLQQVDTPSAAVTAYQTGLALADVCGARMLGLRAMTRLLPLLVLSDPAIARDLIDRFEAFTEGHDTPDWHAASKTLQRHT